MTVLRVSATALRIASILGLANTQARIDRGFQCRALTLIRNLSADFASDSGMSKEAMRTRAATELSRLCQEIEQPKRNYIACLVLLDLLWFAPAHQAVRVEVEELVCSSYVNCRSSDPLKADLRAQVRIRERSAFPYVRSAAVRLRQHEPLDERDVSRLATTDEALREARVGVAGRIVHFHRLILEQQRGHFFERLFEYLAAVIENPSKEYAKEERDGAKQVIGTLREFPLVLVQRFVFPAFARSLRTREIGGLLEKALADHRESLVEFLRERLDRRLSEGSGGDDEIPAVLRLLRSLTKFGVEPAIQYMFDLLESGREPLSVRQNLLDGIERHVKMLEQRIPDIVDRRPQIRSRCERFAGREGLDQFGARIMELLTPTHVSQELSALLVKLALDEASLKEQSALRDSGNACLARLERFFAEPIRTDDECKRLLAFATRLPPKAHPERVALFLWRVYTTFPNERAAIRIAALEALVQITLVANGPADTDVRARLAADLKSAETPIPLRRSIEAAWGRLFPGVRPAWPPRGTGG